MLFKEEEKCIECFDPSQCKMEEKCNSKFEKDEIAMGCSEGCWSGCIGSCKYNSH